MSKLLWRPSEDVVEQSNMARFIRFVNERYSSTIENYHQLHEWSVENIPQFWATIWDFTDIISSREYDEVVINLDEFPPRTKWFPGALLNFAENLLRYREKEQEAISFRGEGKDPVRLSYSELYDSVSCLAEPLRALGVSSNDRVAAYMPNLIETTVAMLATASIGATWSSCGAELGAEAALDRLGQIEPRVLFAVDGYTYKGRVFEQFSKLEKVVKAIPSLEKVVILPWVHEVPDISKIPNSVLYNEFISPKPSPEIQFEQLPFEHPLYIMFSSGTTGKPKCMVQGAGGILINHLKELVLHSDLKRSDKLLYITSPSWMMWNWMVSGLAVGATLALFEGNPLHPDWRTIWKLLEEEKITIFGCSASYIHYLKSIDAKPGKEMDLSLLREISQTGSALSPEGFEYVYEEIKKDIWHNSISGGTDINGCFAGGSPTLPVYAGQLQAAALGMKVKSYNETGTSIRDQQGELVCELPSPSMPLHFWDDPDTQKYQNAYFNYFKGKHLWRHGDYIVIHSDTGGITFYGRSDAVLKPSGVRIGTAEIYNIVEELPEITDSVAIGQAWKGDQRILLFVQLAPGYSFTPGLEDKIRKELRMKASPRHVPQRILETPDVPYTFSGKKVESAIANIIHGRTVTNRGALRNPESLDFFEGILPKLQE
ncbi:MAG: acetoacetate--CoA ligase [Candidatus Hodarchaeales archaeon]